MLNGSRSADVQTVQTTVNQNGFTTEIYAWSDSTVWIKPTHSRISTFIANRQAKVQQIMQPEKWKYVPAEDNPADHTTRPVPAKQLSSLKMWWEGPQWLSGSLMDYPKTTRNSSVNRSKEGTSAEPNINKRFGHYSRTSGGGKRPTQ